MTPNFLDLSTDDGARRCSLKISTFRAGKNAHIFPTTKLSHSRRSFRYFEKKKKEGPLKISLHVLIELPKGNINRQINRLAITFSTGFPFSFLRYIMKLYSAANVSP